ncbi:hypothetical protein AAG570_000957 [Ranatra chinensis]|uniref:Uncharacterized protein n=1 Tax=Ranatra chinensis TaxID=642074 RepID=A0ABD0YYL0_9HEMI
MASKRRNMFHKNKTQETTEKAVHTKRQIKGKLRLHGAYLCKLKNDCAGRARGIGAAGRPRFLSQILSFPMGPALRLEAVQEPSQLPLQPSKPVGPTGPLTLHHWTTNPPFRTPFSGGSVSRAQQHPVQQVNPAPLQPYISTGLTREPSTSPSRTAPAKVDRSHPITTDLQNLRAHLSEDPPSNYLERESKCLGL